MMYNIIYIQLTFKSGIDFYGYHNKKELFLKISLYYF